MRRCEDCGGFIEDQKEAVRITYGEKTNALFREFSGSLTAWFHLQCLVDVERISADDDDPGKRFKRILEER